ncbi:MAG TPA: Mov34/MPN/PAD-1 family protein, partial [Longimicrobiaceae bacterium]|nr:Mov34/MPN/PAD-1 family protein [Longimicrobiaceae bacterium]
AERDGLALVGFYHSHPDGRPEPSRLDREQAWPWYSYLIVAAGSGGAGEARSWRLRDDRSGFRAEEVHSTGEEP